MAPTGTLHAALTGLAASVNERRTGAGWGFRGGESQPAPPPSTATKAASKTAAKTAESKTTVTTKNRTAQPTPTMSHQVPRHVAGSTGSHNHRYNEQWRCDHTEWRSRGAKFASRPQISLCLQHFMFDFVKAWRDTTPSETRQTTVKLF
jgi:hypothetical protein